MIFFIFPVVIIILVIAGFILYNAGTKKIPGTDAEIIASVNSSFTKVYAQTIVALDRAEARAQTAEASAAKAKQEVALLSERLKAIEGKRDDIVKKAMAADELGKQFGAR